MSTLPSPQTPDELSKIESKAAEVTGLAGMVMGAAGIFSSFRKPKNPPATSQGQAASANNTASAPAAPTQPTVSDPNQDPKA